MTIDQGDLAKAGEPLVELRGRSQDPNVLDDVRAVMRSK